MNLSLIGTGRMGTAVADAIADRGWSIHSQFNRRHPFALQEQQRGNSIPDAAIDFSLPHLTSAHVEHCCAIGLPLVIGTTGWSSQLGEIGQLVEQRDGAVLYSPNFSLGIAMLSHALRAVTPMIDRLEHFDISVHEVHHTGKLDSPSGTALRLADIICETVDRKTQVLTDLAPSPVEPNDLLVTASRIGHEFGHHTIWIDGPADRISLSHEARSRRGFAEGALSAAEWLQGRKGIFTLDDMLDDWLSAGAPETSTT